MISQKLQDAINAQIVAEMWSANLYLSMSYFFAAKGYMGHRTKRFFQWSGKMGERF